jgi:hypothetical protein
MKVWGMGWNPMEAKRNGARLKHVGVHLAVLCGVDLVQTTEPPRAMKNRMFYCWHLVHVGA